MSSLALSTRGLDKSFGSLVVAKDVSLELPRGERYALIGPNGAGKTTLINLLTGMLKPDRGQIYLGEEEITARTPEQRVKSGLARTFQINTLFPHLTALEAVSLVVCERRGYAENWWHKLPGYRDAIEEAHAILVSLRNRRKLPATNSRACLWRATAAGNRPRARYQPQGAAAR